MSDCFACSLVFVAAAPFFLLVIRQNDTPQQQTLFACVSIWAFQEEIEISVLSSGFYVHTYVLAVVFVQLVC